MENLIELLRLYELLDGLSVKVKKRQKNKVLDLYEPNFCSFLLFLLGHSHPQKFRTPHDE